MAPQIGIASYLRNLAVRLNRTARQCPDPSTHQAIEAISAELADKAEGLETIFAIPKDERYPTLDSKLKKPS